jgi:hypothetical protein
MYVTLFGDRRGTLPAGWATETIVALLGDAKIDATGAMPQGARMTFLGLAGDAIVVVPPGSRVTGGGLSVFGDRKVEVTPGDGPEIRIDGYSLFGDVKISDQPRPPDPAGRHDDQRRGRCQRPGPPSTYTACDAPS